jgi:hypothetical protein
MQALIDAPHEAARLGANARRDAQARFGIERFGIERFVRDWVEVFTRVAG